MKKRTKIILWTLVGLIGLPALIGTIYLIIMYEPDLKHGWEAGGNLPGRKVLIASSGSSYKQKLLQVLTTQLVTAKLPVKVIPLRELPSIKPKAYRAVILINSSEMYKMDSRVRDFLIRHTNHAHTILVTTSGKGTWKSKRFQIDTISGASKRTLQSTMLDTIMNRVKQIIGTP